MLIFDSYAIIKLSMLSTLLIPPIYITQNIFLRNKNLVIIHKYYNIYKS